MLPTAIFTGAVIFLLGETAHTGALQSCGVDKYVLAAIVRLDEAEALLTIVELYGARVHGDILSLA
jgi:hypothetical protein